MVEYTVLRDYQTAVGLLLAATPERSARYYRDALCTLALAVSWRLVFECTRSRFAALRVLSHGWCACWHLRQMLRPPGLRARAVGLRSAESGARLQGRAVHAGPCSVPSHAFSFAHAWHSPTMYPHLLTGACSKRIPAETHISEPAWIMCKAYRLQVQGQRRRQHLPNRYSRNRSQLIAFSDDTSTPAGCEHQR